MASVFENPNDPNVNQAQLKAINDQNAALLQQIQLQKQAMDAAPKRPEFQSLIDPNTGLLQNTYQVDWGQDVNPDMRGIEAFRERALATGPSAWQGLALNRQGLEEQGLRNQAQAQSAGAQAQARSSLASKYGLSPAAQERLALQGQRQQMSGLQDVGFQGAKARADIGLQDEQMKNQFLSALPGQENALAQVGLQNKAGKIGTQEWNIQNALAEKRAKDQADLNAYHEQMSAYAAQKQSQAMRDAGGGGKK